MVVGTAGTTAAGAIDPLREIAAFCRVRSRCGSTSTPRGAARRFWSPRLRGHLAGIEAADSITCDAHKWFSVPMGAGMFFCRHPRIVAEAFRAHTAYMPPADDGVGGRPLHDLGAMVAPVHRPEAVSRAGASAAKRATSTMIEHQARMGDAAARVARGGRLADRQPDAAAAGVLHPRRPRASAVPRGALSPADRLDVGSAPRRRRAGRAGLHHQFPDDARRTSSGSSAR